MTTEIRPDAAEVEAFIAAAQRGDLASVRAAVEVQPALVLARTPSAEGAIHAAHYHGHVEVCDYLYAHGQPRDVWLHVSLGDLDGVRAALVEDPELARVTRPTLLHQAVWWGYPEIARLLLDHGAPPNMQTTPSGFSPYHSATAAPTPYVPGEQEENVLQCIEVLLAHGADPNLRSALGVTAAFNAAANGDLRVLQRLIEVGCDHLVRAHKNETVYSELGPIDIARQRGHSHVVEYLEALGSR